jgi:hypothetical protein
MNTKTLLTTSLVANVILFGIASYVLSRGPGDLSFPAPVIVCAFHLGTEGVETPPAATMSATNKARGFNTILIESEGCKRYVANLRGNGYSDSAIREILAADVNDLFQVRAHAQVFAKRSK